MGAHRHSSQENTESGGTWGRVQQLGLLGLLDGCQGTLKVAGNGMRGHDGPQVGCSTPGLQCFPYRPAHHHHLVLWHHVPASIIPSMVLQQQSMPFSKQRMCVLWQSMIANTKPSMIQQQGRNVTIQIVSGLIASTP